MKLGEAREYHELIEILRKWASDLGTTMEVVDEVAGLPTRYSSKIFAPVPIKSLGKVSLGAILGALGLKLIVAVDQEQLAKIKHRLTRRKNARTLRPAQTRYLLFKDNPEIARVFQRRWVIKTTPRQRRMWAKWGAKARWPKRKQKAIRS